MLQVEGMCGPAGPDAAGTNLADAEATLLEPLNFTRAPDHAIVLDRPFLPAICQQRKNP